MQSKMTNSLTKYSWDPNILALLVVSEILNHICVTLTEKMSNLSATLQFVVFCYCLTYILHTHYVTHKMDISVWIFFKDDWDKCLWFCLGTKPYKGASAAPCRPLLGLYMGKVYWNQIFSFCFSKVPQYDWPPPVQTCLPKFSKCWQFP